MAERGGRSRPLAGRGPGAAGTLFGIGPVLEALRAGRRPVRQLWIGVGRQEDRRIAELLAEAGRRRIPVGRLEREELGRRAGSTGHQGVVADIEPLPRLELEELDLSPAPEAALVVVLDGVQDPQNLGAILRTAECAGARAVVVPRDRAASLTPAAVKVAEGAAEYVPVVEVTNLVRALGWLKEQGLWVVGLAAEAARPWTAADLQGPAAVVLGGEGTGLRRLVRETCDDLASLPVRGKLSSLNVSAAAAVALYEARRQRDGGSRTGRTESPRALQSP